MALRSSYGVGRYAASEADLFVGTADAWAKGGVRGCVYFHGAGALAGSNQDYTAAIGELHLVRAIAEMFPVLSVDAGGAQAWGNATAMLRGLDARTHLQGTRAAKAGKVVVVGLSMGGLTALNFAKANPSLVAAVVGLVPVCDLNDMVTNNRGGAAANINAAYGGAYVEGTHGPTYNPTNYAASYSVPTKLYYASDDTTALPGKTTAFAATATNVTASSVGALGHSQAAIDAAPRDEILAFLSQYA